MEVVRQTSARAEQLVSEYDLGNIRAEYKGNWRKMGWLAVVFLPLGLLVLVLVLPVLLSPSFTEQSDWWEQLGNLAPAIVWGACSLLASVICLIIFVAGLWMGDQRVYLGEKGFISARRRIEIAARWEEVQEIRRQVLFMKSKTENVRQVTCVSSYVISSAEGKKCSIYADPGPAIEQAVTCSQLPRALDDYAAGKTLSFGWLALDKKGLHLSTEPSSSAHPTALTKLPGIARTPQKLQGTSVILGEHFLPWEKLACYWIDESRSTLVLSKRGERKHWAIIPLYQVPSSALCLALIEYALDEDLRETA